MVRVCQSNRIFLCIRASVRPCVRRLFICPPRYPLLNHLAKFNQACFITSPHGKGVREKHYFSVRPLSVHLSVTLSPNSTKRTTSLLMVRVCESNIIFPSVWRPFICRSRYFLFNHGAICNETCYMTFHHGKGVREQVRPSIRPSVMLLATSMGIVDGAPSTVHSNNYNYAL